MLLKYKNELIDKFDNIDIIEDNGKYILNKDLKQYLAYYFKNANDIFISVNGKSFKFNELEIDDKFILQSNSSNISEIRPPMPGNVIKILVELNQKVSEGEGLLIVEAMKMETTLFSPISGKITAINAEEKQQLSGEEILIVVEKV